MSLLILSLVVFLGIHSVRIFADGWRSRQIARLGPQTWKGLYSLAALAGFVIVVWGYGLAREAPIVIWSPPKWTAHLAALLTAFAFVLVVAAYVPGNSIKAKLHHPMILGVKVWALAHLLANGMLADVVLFGAFLTWAVFDYRAARIRDRLAATVYAAGNLGSTVAATVVGLAAWAGFALWLHARWIGVSPF